jgi:DNA-binding IclR family transcriptional regulator
MNIVCGIILHQRGDNVMEIWKICRVLNNPIRFALLREIMISPNHAQNVVLAGERLGCKKSLTSQYLKKLAEAGLLSVKRTGRYAVCSTSSLRRSPVARLQLALSEFFAETHPTCDDDAVLATINALSHHGRINILHIVSEHDKINFSSLAKHTAYPFATLRRQLGVLIEGGIVSTAEDAAGVRTYSLSTNLTKLPFVLVSLALDRRLTP